MSAIATNVNSKGNAQEQIGHVKERFTQEHIVKKVETKEQCDFRIFQNFQNTGPPNSNAELLASPIPSRCRQNNNYNVTPRRAMILLSEVSRSEALTILNVTENNLSKEIHKNCIRLARKYYTDKQNENYEFTKEVSESVFKNLANTCKILKDTH